MESVAEAELNAAMSDVRLVMWDRVDESEVAADTGEARAFRNVRALLMTVAAAMAEARFLRMASEVETDCVAETERVSDLKRERMAPAV